MHAPSPSCPARSRLHLRPAPCPLTGFVPSHVHVRALGRFWRQCFSLWVLGSGSQICERCREKSLFSRACVLITLLCPMKNSTDLSLGRRPMLKSVEFFIGQRRGCEKTLILCEIAGRLCYRIWEPDPIGMMGGFQALNTQNRIEIPVTGRSGTWHPTTTYYEKNDLNKIWSVQTFL